MPLGFFVLSALRMARYFLGDGAVDAGFAVVDVGATGATVADAVGVAVAVDAVEGPSSGSASGVSGGLLLPHASAMAAPRPKATSVDGMTLCDKLSTRSCSGDAALHATKNRLSDITGGLGRLDLRV